MTEAIKITVNNEEHTLNVHPETPLLFVLRNNLKLKSPKLGCAKEQCGACKVLVDGNAVPSCELPIERVAGLSITTLEGLGTADNLHPLQEAFIDQQTSQCGYCTAGFIMACIQPVRIWTRHLRIICVAVGRMTECGVPCNCVLDG